MVKDRKKKVTKKMITAMKQLKKLGVKQQTIAKNLGVSSGTVSNYVGKHQRDMTLKKESGKTSEKNTIYPTFPDEMPPTVEEKIVGTQGLFVREWSKVAVWLGLAIIVWGLLLVH